MPIQTTISPIVSLQPVEVQPNVLRLDVLMQNLPEHFVGLGFDLLIEGGDWSFQHYEPGSIFSQPNDVLVLAAQKDQPEKRLVFGLSLKGTTLDSSRTFQNGTMVSLYFQTENPEALRFHFANVVFSIFDQERKDISQVRWEAPKFQVSETIGDFDLQDLPQEAPAKLIPSLTEDFPQSTISMNDFDPFESESESESEEGAMITPNNHLINANLLHQDFPLSLFLEILGVAGLIFVVSKIIVWCRREKV